MSGKRALVYPRISRDDTGKGVLTSIKEKLKPKQCPHCRTEQGQQHQSYCHRIR